MKNGLVLSDLHLFANRSNPARVQQALDAVERSTDFIVLNGDIFDFRWSHYATPDETIRAGLDWLRALMTRHDNTTLYYIMGNHDCSHPWAQALNSLEQKNFHWSPTHFILGDSLFLHGDLPLEGKHPFTRILPQAAHTMPARHIMNPLYNGAITLRLHTVPSMLCTPRLCSTLIHRAFQKHNCAPPENVKHLYFGHTHAPFTNHQHLGLTFHNTGSAIHHLALNAIQVKIDD